MHKHVAILACMLFQLVWSAQIRAQPIDIGSRLELFVDSLMVSEMDGVELRLHRPREARTPSSPPSDGHYATVILDRTVYRLYNRGGHGAAYDGDPVEYTAYFESDDGIEWRRPQLDLFQLPDSSVTNAVLAHSPPFSHNFSPFLDTGPGVPDSERYKALAGTSETGLVAFVSPDGIRWAKLREEPVFTKGIFDSQNVSFWSDHEGLYVCYFRTWTGEGYTGLRTISRTTSPDFVNWSDPVAMNPNEAGEHLYTSGTHPYFRAPHIYIALPTRFHPGRGNATDILLMSTRGGDRFDRLFKEAFIRPGTDKMNWGNRANYAALNVVPTGEDEMSIYVRGRRFILRTDGFVSVHAGHAQGYLTTPPLIFSGERLVLNASTSAGGHVVTEILDHDGAPVEGFKASSSDTLVADGIALEVGWKGAPDLSSLSGRAVRLRFLLKEADLYSFQFTTLTE
jgi:hypothetical protein